MLLTITTICGKVALIALAISLVILAFDYMLIYGVPDWLLKAGFGAMIVFIVAFVAWLSLGTAGYMQQKREAEQEIREVYHVNIWRHPDYKYIVDENSGIVYIKSGKDLAPAYNSDGSLMTAEDLQKHLDEQNSKNSSEEVE